jgi:hypothetical protein
MRIPYLVSGATAIAIENDSQVVFDALAAAVALDLVGTILHYQIVAQHGSMAKNEGLFVAYVQSWTPKYPC